MPVLAYIGEIVVEDLDINPDEVEEAFVVSLRKLCDPDFFRYTRFRNIVLPSYIGGKHRVWGFTGAITHVVLECLIPDVYRNKLQMVSYQRSKESNIPNIESKRKLINEKNTLSKI